MTNKLKPYMFVIREDVGGTTSYTDIRFLATDIEAATKEAEKQASMWWANDNEEEKMERGEDGWYWDMDRRCRVSHGREGIDQVYIDNVACVLVPVKLAKQIASILIEFENWQELLKSGDEDDRVHERNIRKVMKIRSKLEGWMK